MDNKAFNFINSRLEDISANPSDEWTNISHYLDPQNVWLITSYSEDFGLKVLSNGELNYEQINHIQDDYAVTLTQINESEFIIK